MLRACQNQIDPTTPLILHSNIVDGIHYTVRDRARRTRLLGHFLGVLQIFAGEVDQDLGQIQILAEIVEGRLPRSQSLVEKFRPEAVSMIAANLCRSMPNFFANAMASTLR